MADIGAFKQQGKKQNKKILEEDGIKCFDLKNTLLVEEFDLRESIGAISNKSNKSRRSQEKGDQGMLLEIERLSHECEELQLMV